MVEKSFYNTLGMKGEGHSAISYLLYWGDLTFISSLKLQLLMDILPRTTQESRGSWMCWIGNWSRLRDDSSLSG